MRLAGHPFYLTLFVPQTSSLPERPHPLITAFLAATARSTTEAP
jgi:CTP synthase (UTP-ammonia lyase)